MWHLIVVDAVYRLFGLAALVLGLIALVSCALQRADAFVALGTMQKGAWLAVLGLTTLLVLISGPFVILFAAIALAASILYLVDIRPGLRDVTGGYGP